MTYHLPLTTNFQNTFATLQATYKKEDCIIITDSNIAPLYPEICKYYKTITIPAGEEQKTLQTIESLATQLLQLGAYRKTSLIGLGGGVITDITGYLATSYMRGLPCGFIPTTLLGMVDASIGGKNGVNMGMHKNILGTIRQPSFILFDTSFLNTLPAAEWSNGFAEIIKYACVFDKELFNELSSHDIDFYKNDNNALEQLITKCVGWKNKIVQEDENENGNRKLLNFGHTAGHALEKLYSIPHGQAVAIGMVIACKLAEIVNGFDSNATKQLATLLQQYQLPSSINFDADKIMDILKMDKKRDAETIDYILPLRVGHAVITPLPFNIIHDTLSSLCK